MTQPTSSRVTQLLGEVGESTPPREWLDEVFPLVQDELRQLAGRLMRSERPDHTLQPTALVNEAFLKLADADSVSVRGRTYFFGVAARTMRRILVDHARDRAAAKRGGNWKRVTLTGCAEFPDDGGVDVIEMDDALKQLASLDERMEKVVEYRVFGGLRMEEIATLLDITRRTVQSDWRIAVMWLRRYFAEGPQS